MMNVLKTRFGGLFFAQPIQVIARLFRSMWVTSFYLYKHADLTVFRVLFAGASFSEAFYLGINPGPFSTQPSFFWMRELSPLWVWVFLFALHGVAVSWRLVDERPRIIPALIINCYGFGLWCLYVVLQDVAMHYSIINSSAERVLVFISFFTIPATGTRRELVSP